MNESTIAMKLSNCNESTYVDFEDYERIKNHTWRARKKDKTHATHYAICSLRINKKVKHQYLHRLIMNAKDGEIVDHIDGNGLNNRKSNLRIVTKSQNQLNSKVYKNNNSGYSGINWQKDRNKWRVRLFLDKQSIHIGYFDTIEEAIYARKSTELSYLGNLKERRTDYSGFQTI